MSVGSAIARARGIIRRPPGHLLERAIREMECELDRWLAPRRQRALGRERLLALALAPTIDHLWQQLRHRSFPAVTVPVDPAVLDRIEPGESKRIRAAAESARRRTVDLLGTGPIMLGSPIDWS